VVGQVNSLGYGNNVRDRMESESQTAKQWIIRSQAPKGDQSPMEKVQRLSGGGLCLSG
jgi:hypothetical protein